MLRVLVGNIMTVSIPMMVMSVPVVILHLASEQLLVVFSLGIVFALPCGREKVAELFTKVFAEVLWRRLVSMFRRRKGRAHLGIIASSFRKLLQCFLLDARLPILQERPSIHADFLLQDADITLDFLHVPGLEFLVRRVHIVTKVSNFPDEGLHREFKLVVVAHDGRMADEE